MIWIPSLRGAKRRSNPRFLSCCSMDCLAYARNDGLSENGAAVGWAKRSVPTTLAKEKWWARRKRAFAHPTIQRHPLVPSPERHMHLTQPRQIHGHAVPGVEPYCLDETPGQHDLAGAQGF